MPGRLQPTVYERRRPAPGLVQESLRTTRSAVFWLEDQERDAATTDYPALTADTVADLVVVGGGYCGLWTAIIAKRRDPSLRVVLLEAQTIGWAASGRNGGFCEASLTHGEENGRSRWPGEYDELARLGEENLAGLEADVAALGIDCQLERTGSLSVAVEEHQVPWVSADPSTHLDATAVRAEIDSPIFLAGAWEREGCVLVHPGRLAAGLARAAAELGVEIHEHSAVEALDGAAGLAGQQVQTVRTARATVRAKRVALATNVFRPLLRRARPLTVPVYDYVLMTDPLSTEQMAAIGWHHRQGLTDLANQFHYARLTADNRVLYGGYDAVYPRGGRLRASHEERPASYERLASHFLTTFPQLEGVRFSHRWSGPIDTCTRFAAFHGSARRGRVAYAAGFTGLGVGATRFAAQVMVDRLTDQDTPRTRLEMVRKLPLPFPPEPLAGVGIALTKWSLDRADHQQGQRNSFLRVLDRLGLGFDS
ncbi:FAD-dependent oxidoreductase [Dermatophilaceae bacterium Soc4.6]